MLQKKSTEMMNKEEKILNEIRRQAFIRADQRCREEELVREARYTLDALQELTKLPRRELETIAAEVRARNLQEEKEFFSVKNQLLMVSSGLGFIGLLVWIFTHLVF